MMYNPKFENKRSVQDVARSLSRFREKIDFHNDIPFKDRELLVEGEKISPLFEKIGRDTYKLSQKGQYLANMIYENLERKLK